MVDPGLLPAYVQATAIVVAGLWAYWRLFRQRSDEPATDIDVDLRFLGVQRGMRLVEVAALLENKSFVRHRYQNFRLRVRYLLPGDEIYDGDERLLYQVVFPHSIDERLDPKAEPWAGRQFGNIDYINPRQRFQHHYPTFIPAEATYVLVHCRFDFSHSRLDKGRRKLLGKRETVYVDTQKVFAVT